MRSGYISFENEWCRASINERPKYDLHRQLFVIRRKDHQQLVFDGSAQNREMEDVKGGVTTDVNRQNPRSFTPHDHTRFR